MTTHLSGLRKAGLCEVRRRCMMLSTMITAPSHSCSTLTQEHRNMHVGCCNRAASSTLWPLVVPQDKGVGRGSPRLWKESETRKIIVWKQKPYSMPGSEWMSHSVLGAEIPWRRHLIKKGRMPVMCFRSCHCNASIILTAFWPTVCNLCKSKLFSFPSEPNVHQCQIWLDLFVFLFKSIVFTVNI